MPGSPAAKILAIWLRSVKVGHRKATVCLGWQGGCGSLATDPIDFRSHAEHARAIRPPGKSSGWGSGRCSRPPGVTCSDHEACPTRDVSCPKASEGCLDVPGCGVICISTEQAVEETCPGAYTIFQSDPPQLVCEGATPGHN